MGLIRLLFIVYSYLFHSVLALILVALSIVSAASHLPLQITFLPWSGKQLASWLLWLGIIALLSIFLAVTKKVRLLFLLWSLAVLAFLVRGFFAGPYSFTAPGQFRNAMYLTFAALSAVPGAWWQLRQHSRSYRRRR